MCTKSFDEWSQIKDSLVVGQIEEIYWGIVPLMIQTWNLVRMSREKYLHTRFTWCWRPAHHFGSQKQNATMVLRMIEMTKKSNGPLTCINALCIRFALLCTYETQNGATKIIIKMTPGELDQ